MLDVKFIRENIEEVKEGIRKKNSKVDLERFLVLDDERKKIQKEFEEKKAEQNIASKKIGEADADEREKMILEVSNLKEKVQELEKKMKPVLEEWNEILMNIPNPPSPEMPEGKSDEDNVTIYEWGEKPKFSFEPKTHDILGKNLDIIDVEKAAEVTGSRFYYLKGDMVFLQFAMTRFAFDVLTDENIIKQILKEKNLEHLSSKPFIPMLPPVMIKNEVQEAIHRVFGDQTYKFGEDNLNLVASAEHTLAPYHMNEVLDEKDLPMRYIGHSTAFRREAGTYGKDMKGIFRAHQFDKTEIESFTSAETGADEQKLIVGLQEYLMQALKLPYRLQQVCTGDTGKPDYQQFDIEAWLPGQNAYRETHTSDYMTDYQTRGIKSFYKTKDGERKLLHTNDATAFAGRPLVAILEMYQKENGDIEVPEVLQKYMGGRNLITKRD